VHQIAQRQPVRNAQFHDDSDSLSAHADGVFNGDNRLVAASTCRAKAVIQAGSAVTPAATGATTANLNAVG
jgi:hypothetical protein